MNFTVFGGSGFVGKSLVDYLTRKGHDVFVPVRNDEGLMGLDLGHVIYAIGLTGDFRARPFDTVEAHVGVLSRLLQSSRFDSWLYLSSARVYGRLGENSLAQEDMQIPVFPDSDGLYDVSKLLGEALCLAQSNPRIRIARLSNVYGHNQSEHTFLAAVLNELKNTGKVVIQEAPESSKDYISLVDIPPLLEEIALSGRERIYNVASGRVVTHGELASKLSQLTCGTVLFEENAPCRVFPKIDISRVANEFAYTPRLLFNDIIELLDFSNN
jgi:nucleoside-diphosphate-sugar epimerase